jgi:hypothetical protein
LLSAAKPQEAFDPRPLLRRVRGSLLEFLPSLSPGGWQASTLAEPWLFRALVAHLVGDDLARLSRSRDVHSPGQPAHGEPLPQFLDRHNAEWVAAMQRISPRTLTELLTWTSGRISDFWGAEDLAALGEPVSWVGPDPAPRWLDCVRDFAEDWVHQQQIREAVSRMVGYDRRTGSRWLDFGVSDGTLSHRSADTERMFAQVWLWPLTTTARSRANLPCSLKPAFRKVCRIPGKVFRVAPSTAASMG